MGEYAEWISSFVVQTLSGVVAVFVGVWLALVVERKRRVEDAETSDAEAIREFDRALDTILGSVVKNTAEAKRILRALEHQKRPQLIHAAFETSTWYASQDRFIALCRNVDERIIFAQFFDEVRRLQAFVDFRCNLHVSTTTGKLDCEDPDLHALIVGIDRHLAGLAEDLRFCGVVLVTDHGKPVHRRLMGITSVAAVPAG
ncbi:MAG TPA: hypothetical protein VKM00_02215 [Luteimonas sp.]|nr:hypothetical protein [Luteimonas sp.]